MIYLSELLLYVCFCIVVGNQLLAFVPADKRPTVAVPNWLINLCIIGIALLSFSPVLRVTLIFAKDYNVSFWTIFKGILMDFNIGHAWLVTLFLCLILLLVRILKKMTNDPILEHMGAFLTFALILAFGWASHCTASYELKGFIPHAIHFLSVTVWIGVLFVVGWFSKNSDNWLKFLKWFSPIAFICVITTMSAGFFLMNLLVPDYVNSWIVSYGQALLIKHLFIIPLLTFALINGVLVRRKININPNFNPIPWVRAESVMALLVFTSMAVMGQQSTPENIAAIIKFEKPSWLFEAFYNGKIEQDISIHFGVNALSIASAITAILFLIALVVLFRRKDNVFLSGVCGVLFVICAYVSLMIGVV
ncbi:copper resistance protein CopD [Anoxybacillus sp. PDR2]|uniref:Putative copper resistance protein D n=1 Tax=Parageobacillus thermantarcticus TaxID=186116 RepID=A0A1I0TLV3_9BACL|nr:MULTISPECIES: CopD family protein [Bacillaceae]QHC05361.1 copper resistance protein CopD [Anoxybacillus sp. PDR2]SFA52771.1 putative copper resistance protein D [Parageobacillus thermantarcticus]